MPPTGIPAGTVSATILAVLRAHLHQTIGTRQTTVTLIPIILGGDLPPDNTNVDLSLVKTVVLGLDLHIMDIIQTDQAPILTNR
jgi:hypothetical protein